jgi:hypothetical protein
MFVLPEPAVERLVADGEEGDVVDGDDEEGAC